jgi:hypothetical protein
MTAIDINAWQQVPELVSALLPAAAQVRAAHDKAALATDMLAASTVTWNPELNAVTLYTPRPLTKAAYAAYEKACYDGERVFASLVGAEPNWDEEILIKQAAIPGAKHVFELGNAALGGPTPLSNGIVSALMLGGLGYGTGALAEQLFPERYMRRGRLRKTLGLAGALSGLGVGAVNAYANARALKQPYLKSLVTKNTTPVVYPFEQEMAEKTSYVTTYGYNPRNPYVPDAVNLDQPSISVPQFNTALWHDAYKGMTGAQPPMGMHTPPPLAATASGLMTGISTGLRSPMIRPSDVVRGFASAGVGLATANLAGRTLSALAGITPEAQNKLQDLGIWGGMMHAVIPPLFQGR